MRPHRALPTVPPPGTRGDGGGNGNTTSGEPPRRRGHGNTTAIQTTPVVASATQPRDTLRALVTEWLDALERLEHTPHSASEPLEGSRR